MDSFTKQGIMMVAAVLVLGLILLFSSGSSNDTEIELNKQSILANGENSTDPQMEPNNDGEISQANIDPKKWFASPLRAGIPSTLDLSLRDADKELGAKAIKLAEDGKWVNVPFTFKSTPRCMVGDLDLILREKALDRDAPFIVSLEPLNGNRKDLGPAFSKTVDPFAFGAGASVALKVPKSATPVHYGFFICRDSERTGSCLKKPAGNISKLLQEHYSEKGANPPVDRIYYFQYLLQENDTFTLVNSLLDNNKYNKLDKYLQKRTKNSFSASNASSTAQQINQSIRSAPIELKNRTLTVDLPKHDRGLCRREPPPKLSGSDRRKIKEINERRKKRMNAAK